MASKSVAAIIAIVSGERVGEMGGTPEDHPYFALADLVALPEVRGLFREEILRLGGQLAPGARVRRFVLLDRPLGIDDSETMLSRELRRRSAEQAHADLIAALLRDGVTATEVPDEVDAAGRVSGVFIEDIGESTVSWAPAHA